MNLATHVYDERARLGRHADTYLCLWILAWDAHALVAQPGRLFDANHLYPARNTLAGQENLLGLVPFSAPVYWASGNPVLAAHVAMLATYVVGAFGMFLLVRGWTGPLPAFAAGLAFAFAPWRIPTLATLQHLAVHWWPFLLLALERFVETGSGRALAGVTGALVASTLSGIYYGYAAFFLVGLHALCHHGTLRRHPRRALGLVAACGAAALLLAPILLPYVRLRAQGIVSPLHPKIRFVPLDLLVPELPSYAPPLVLALIASGFLLRVRPAPRPDRIPRRAWGLAAGIVVLGLVLALGTYLHWQGTAPFVPLPSLLLGRVVPGFSSVRVPDRFLSLFGLGVAIALGLALGEIQERLRGRPGRVALAVLVLGIGGGLWWRRVPVSLEEVPVGTTLPPVYRFLAAWGARRPLLELNNFHTPRDEAQAMYFSTFHWLPLVNGHTGHHPPTFGVLMALARRLPAPEALQKLVNLIDLGWVLVQRENFRPAALARWEPTPAGLELVGRFDTADLYRVVLAPDPDLRDRFSNWLVAAETLGGTPLAPLPREGRVGRVATTVPTPVRTVPGWPVRVKVVVLNLSPMAWPAEGVAPRHLVVLRVRWRDQAGREIGGWGADVRLPADLAPGRVTGVTVEAPTGNLEVGEARLEIALAQDDEPFPASQAPPLELPVRIGPRPAPPEVHDEPGGRDPSTAPGAARHNERRWTTSPTTSWSASSHGRGTATRNTTPRAPSTRRCWACCGSNGACSATSTSRSAPR